MTAIVKGRRRGAPKKPPEDSRTVTVTLRLTPGEYAWLEVEAEKGGLTRALGRFLLQRAMGTGWKIVPAINRAAWSHLDRWAGAVTTIANAAAGERLAALYPHLNPSLEFMLDAVRADLRALRLALIGLDRASQIEAEEAERRWSEATGEIIDEAEFGPGGELNDERASDEINPNAPINWDDRL